MTAWQLRQAVMALRTGGVIAYPTETVYGLGCDPLNQPAVAALLQLKQRPVEKGLILIGANLQHLQPYINVDDPALLQQLQTATRPITWVTPARQNVPYWLTGRHDSIAVRISSHPLAAVLCQQFGGAIVSTSANPAEQAPARTALTVRRYFNDRLDLILHSTLDPGNKPSEIRDLLTGEVFRNG